MSIRIRPEEMKKLFMEKLRAHGVTDAEVAEESGPQD